MNRNKKLLVLDLDGTLVETVSKPHPCMPYDMEFTIQKDPYYLYKRPYLDDFMEWAFDNYKVAIWSAGIKEYVEIIVSTLLPEGKNYEFIWTRNNCATDEDHKEYYKPLVFIWEEMPHWNRENTLIVDDLPMTYKFNKHNAIPIKAYTLPPTSQCDLVDDVYADDTLIDISQVLKFLKDHPDIRRAPKILQILNFEGREKGREKEKGRGRGREKIIHTLS